LVTENVDIKFSAHGAFW